MLGTRNGPERDIENLLALMLLSSGFGCIAYMEGFFVPKNARLPVPIIVCHSYSAERNHAILLLILTSMAFVYHDTTFPKAEDM